MSYSTSLATTIFVLLFLYILYFFFFLFFSHFCWIKLTIKTWYGTFIIHKYGMCRLHSTPLVLDSIWITDLSIIFIYVLFINQVNSKRKMLHILIIYLKCDFLFTFISFSCTITQIYMRKKYYNINMSLKHIINITQKSKTNNINHLGISISINF